MICKNCKHFFWKLTGSRNWGECLNSKVQSSIRLSLKLVNLGKPELDDVRTYTRIHFDEDSFGCILFEENEEEVATP